MKEPIQNQPFKSLGTRLRYLRERLSESLAEVSGAVEINEDALELIEQGVERPSEEILMLLINHFDMHEMDALQLWELAGYDRHNALEMMNMGMTDDASEIPNAKPMVMMIAIDTRTQYTDSVDVHVNNAGVVMTFSQVTGLNQRQAVSRVGMSLQQAAAVSEILQQALIKARYGTQSRALPASHKSKSSKSAPLKSASSTQKPTSAKRTTRRRRSSSTDDKPGV